MSEMTAEIWARRISPKVDFFDGGRSIGILIAGTDDKEHPIVFSITLLDELVTRLRWATGEALKMQRDAGLLYQVKATVEPIMIDAPQQVDLLRDSSGQAYLFRATGKDGTEVSIRIPAKDIPRLVEMWKAAATAVGG